MGTFRIPAPPFVFCPRCKECNDEKAEQGLKVKIWWYVDERGKHSQCKTCAHAWTGPSGEWQGIPAKVRA